MNTLDFDTLMSKAISNANYDSLPLDSNNDLALCLLADGDTCVIICRNRGEIGRFERESYFSGGHWSDVDIATALELI